MSSKTCEHEIGINGVECRKCRTLVSDFCKKTKQEKHIESEIERLMFFLYYEPFPEYEWTEEKIREIVAKAVKAERAELELCKKMMGAVISEYQDKNDELEAQAKLYEGQIEILEGAMKDIVSGITEYAYRERASQALANLAEFRKQQGEMR